MKNLTRKNRLTLVFAERFGAAQPRIWSRAPGRVDLMGSHTDYNEGYVLTCTIDRDTWIAARPRNDRKVNLYSTNLGAAASFDWQNTDKSSVPRWASYVYGVGVMMERAGFRPPGCDAVIDGSIPLGSGLSSSASLEVAAGILFGQLGGFTIDRLRLARLCQQAENEIVGVNCGILDQYSSIFGRRHTVLLLDCRHLTSSQAAFPRDIGLVLCNTCVPRELAQSEYGRRRSDCETGAALIRNAQPAVRTLRDVSPDVFTAEKSKMPGDVARRCQFIIEENGRVVQMADALARNDKSEIGRIAAASYAGARDLYEITVPAMHAMMEAMLSGPGIIGARQSGAGFGGCMAAFVELPKVEGFSAHVGAHYTRSMGIKPEIYSLHTSDGAGVVA